MFRICKKFTFEAAHQLEEAFTEACMDCIHGHSYTVEMYLVAESLNDWQMVVDFGRLKAFKKTIMDKWDHGLHLHMVQEPHYHSLIHELELLKKEKVTFWPVQPTAEAMAERLWNMLNAYLHTLPYATNKVNVEKVRVHETSTGWAEYQESTHEQRWKE